MFSLFKRDTNKTKDEKGLDDKARKQAVKDEKKNKKEGVKFVEMKDKGLFIDETPYNFSSSYISHNGRYSAVLRLSVKQGSNRNMTFLDVLDFIPNTTNENVQIHLITRDKMFNQDKKRKLILENTKINKASIKNRMEEDERKEEVKKDDESKRNKQKTEYEDYIAYEMILDSTIPVALYDLRLIVTADKPEQIDDQVEQINTKLDQNHSGATWYSEPGNQSRDFEEIFSELPEDNTIFTATGDQYAGFNLSVNAGLHDEQGIPLGEDVLSLTRSKAYMDFDQSLKKQAIIATPSDSYHPMYATKDKDAHTLSSTLSQAAANDSVLKGHKAHHIVLNDFDYFDDSRRYRLNGSKLTKQEKDEVFKVYDMSKVTLNPLEGFGHYQDTKPDADSITDIYSRLIMKNVNIFNALLGFEMSQAERTFLTSQLQDFYAHMGYWDSRAVDNPRGRSQIIQISDPTVYATMSRFISFLDNSATKSGKEGDTDIKRDYVLLKTTLENALTENSRLIGRTTSIQRTNALQVYYDFNSIDTLQYRQVQLLNTIDYIMYTAEKGDVVVIHGLNEIYESLLDMISGTIRAAQKRGVRFIFSFDTMTGSKVDKKFKYADLFDLRDRFYKNLSTEVDYFILGTMLPEEVHKLEHNYLNENIGTTVRNTLIARDRNQFLIHRGVDGVNNFILSMFLI